MRIPGLKWIQQMSNKIATCISGEPQRYSVRRGNKYMLLPNIDLALCFLIIMLNKMWMNRELIILGGRVLQAFHKFPYKFRTVKYKTKNVFYLTIKVCHFPNSLTRLQSHTASKNSFHSCLYRSLCSALFLALS